MFVIGQTCGAHLDAHNSCPPATRNVIYGT